MAWSDYFPFLKSPALKAITDAIDNLQANVGTGSPDNWYDTVAEIRELTGYSDKDVVGLTSDTMPILYQFDTSVTNADDGNNYLTPDDITEPASGRWVKRITFSVAGHTHADKLDKPLNPVQNVIYVFNEDGELVSTGKTLASFVPAEDGKGLSSNDFTDEYKEILENIPEDIDVSGKMNKVTPTVTNEGNALILNEEGDASDSGIKPIDQVHPIYGDEQSAEEGGTISYAFRDVTKWKTARIFFTLYTDSNSIVQTAMYIFKNTGGEPITGSPEQYCPDIDFTATVTIENNIPTLNLLINTTPETIYCTRPKIIYN